MALLTADRPATASHSGSAVEASAKLWTVSASTATEPLARATTSCSSAVTPNASNDTRTARMPSVDPSSSRSTASPGLAWA